MGSFGENLRREREMRGVSLAEISAATKISVRFLEAIENEEFLRLPGGVFTRGFIRAYSKHLGLDEEYVLAEYQLAAKPGADVDLLRMNQLRAPASGGRSRSPILSLLVAVLLLGGGYALFRRSRRIVETPGAASTPARVVAAPSPEAAKEQTTATSASVTPPPSPPDAAGSTSQPQPGPGNQGVANAASSVPAQPASAAPNASSATNVPWADGGLVLQVAVTEPSWVAVDADGKTVFQRALKAHEVQTLKAKQSFDVVTGNAQGTILTLNGETLKPLGGHNVYRKIHLTHEDVKDSGH